MNDVALGATPLDCDNNMVYHDLYNQDGWDDITDDEDGMSNEDNVVPDISHEGGEYANAMEDMLEDILPLRSVTILSLMFIAVLLLDDLLKLHIALWQLQDGIMCGQPTSIGNNNYLQLYMHILNRSTRRKLCVSNIAY